MIGNEETPGPLTGNAVIPCELLFDPTIRQDAKMVYLVLSAHTDRHHRCFPSHALIAAEAGLSVATVKRRLAELRDADLVTWQPRTRAKTHDGKLLKPVNVYTLSGNSSHSTNGVADQPTISSETPTISSESGPIEPLSLRTSLKDIPRAARADLSEHFAEFWQWYPRKVAKPAAERAWKAAVKRGNDEVAILTGLARWSAVADLTRPEFIPHPATWINQERWKDEPTVAGQSRSRHETEVRDRIAARRNPLASLL